MRQLVLQTELLRHESPVLVESLKFSDKIGQRISVGIDKPIQLIPMRRGMDASGTAVLDPIDKLFEAHFIPELQRFCALIQRYNPVPRIANKSEFEVGLELLAAGFFPALFRQQQIQRGHDPVLSSAVLRPGGFHQLFDLPQIQVRFPRFAKDCPDAGRSSLGHLNENAFVFMRDHYPTVVNWNNDYCRVGLRLPILIGPQQLQAWVGRDSNPEPTP